MHAIHIIACTELYITYLFIGRHMATFTLTCMWQKKERDVAVPWAPGKWSQVAVPSLLFLIILKIIVMTLKGASVKRNLEGNFEGN